MIHIKDYHIESAIIGMWRMGATVEQIQQQDIPYTTFYIKQVIEDYEQIHSTKNR